MAKSNAHVFGQIIGELVEQAIKPCLSTFASEHGLFLDSKGKRPARPGKRVRWTDHLGNGHDLDFVMERGGAPDTVGIPVAFIETAWRSYTKHSRNKAQEIQGAIQPLVETYRVYRPFAGVILVGVFTQGAMDQLKSLGFSILYFPREPVDKAFELFGIDASFDEDTPERDIRRKINAWNKLSPKQQDAIGQALVDAKKAEIAEFLKQLEVAATRRIAQVRVLPLHGDPVELSSLDKARVFIENYEVKRKGRRSIFVRFEIQVRFTNGDSVEGKFAAKEHALEFLLAVSAGCGSA